VGVEIGRDTELLLLASKLELLTNLKPAKPLGPGITPVPFQGPRSVLHCAGGDHPAAPRSPGLRSIGGRGDDVPARSRRPCAHRRVQSRLKPTRSPTVSSRASLQPRNERPRPPGAGRTNQSCVGLSATLQSIMRCSFLGNNSCQCKECMNRQPRTSMSVRQDLLQPPPARAHRL
jgi:hypothetical protein